MGFDFRFRSLGDETELRELEDFLRIQSLEYPNYQDWVTRTREDLLEGYKTAILAFSEGRIIGDLVFQPHKTFSRVREFKNLRVHPRLRNRYFGGFMLKQGEMVDSEEYDAIVGDVRSNQLGALALFKNFGYEELARAPLYEKEVEEVIMVKRFEKTPEGFFAPIKRELVA